MTSAAEVGGTGLVGKHILSTLLESSPFNHVSAFTRKPLNPSDPHSRLRPILSSETSSWAQEYSSISPSPTVFYSALGTTRAQAGSFAAQRKIDLDLNLSLARAAKEAGTKYYVLISSGGVSSSSIFPYSKMKGELEEEVKKVGFEKTVLVKPGLIVGTRTDSRYAEAMFRYLANFLGRISGGVLKDFWAQDADVIGRAAAKAGEMCVDGTARVGGVWYVGVSEIWKLGKAEGKKKD